MSNPNIHPLDCAVLETLPAPALPEIRAALAAELPGLGRKIVVLDDDPTGIQTVHGVPVYTDWLPETVETAFREEGAMFFLLTNSRGFTVAETRAAHAEIARNIAAASRATGKDFLVISRGDSTLRGHYPLETETLRRTLEAETGKHYDGEIIFPFFKEGGRFTLDGVHYVREGGRLVPAGETEFARDKSFGYRSSDLADWCDEKTGGAYPAAGVVRVRLDDLRAAQIGRVQAQLEGLHGFGKAVVDAADYCDVEAFAAAFIRAVRDGHEYLLRTAAAVTKVLGGVPDKPLLTRGELVDPGNQNGGIILVGSHVSKTTRQLEALRGCARPVEFLEFNQHLVLTPGGLSGEVARVVALAEEHIQAGRTVAVYTRRERFDLPTGDPDEQLRVSVEISDAVTSIVGKLEVRPAFIIAKGGITSSDVGTKALRVKKAMVMGQIQPGVPVWMTGAESKFPNLPYVIFPGNVGEDDTLRKAVEILMG